MEILVSKPAPEVGGFGKKIESRLGCVGSFLQVEEEEEESRSRKLVNVVKVKTSGVESSNSWSKRGNFADFI